MAGRSSMITAPAVRASLLVLAVLAVSGCNRVPPDGLALTGATILDGVSERPQTGMVLVIRNDRIEAMGTPDEVSIPRRMRTLDLGGKFVIPGLIDAHVHVAPWTLDRFLASGVTSVRDMHGTLDSILALRERANLNAISSPRIFSAGAMIDGSPSIYTDAMAVGSANDARRAVDQLAVKGVDYVKVYTRITPELLRAIADEAGTFGLKIAAHLGYIDAVTAADLGVRSIEHLSGIPEAAVPSNAALMQAHRSGFFAGWTAFEKSWTTLDSAAMARVATHLVDSKVTLVPTLVLHETFSRLDDPALAQSEGMAAVPPEEVIAWNVPDMIARARWTAADFEAFRQARTNQDRFVRMFKAAGGRVVAGSDAANQMLVPGESLIRELELLVRLGFTPAEALMAATRDAALLLGADSLGAIVPGRKADLVILGADPLASISNLRQVEQVMVRGHLMPADSLRRRW